MRRWWWRLAYTLRAAWADATASAYLTAAVVELRTTELRVGISMIEAAAVDAFQADLLTVTAPNDEEGRAELREMTIELAKMGVRTEDLAGILRMYHLTQMFDLSTHELRTMGMLLMERERDA